MSAESLASKQEQASKQKGLVGLTNRVVLKVVLGHAIEGWISQHANIQVCVGKPLHSLFHILNRA